MSERSYGGPLVVRGLIGAAAGLVVGLAGVAGWGLHYGYHEGVSSNPALGVGWNSAWVMAFYCLVFFGWATGGGGAVIGGLAGLTSWLARPNQLRGRPRQ